MDTGFRRDDDLVGFAAQPALPVIGKDGLSPCRRRSIKEVR
jgi:hypothetical protein